MNTVNEDGKCATCTKDAQAECMQCFLCKNRFHVINCSVDALIQKSFLQNTWPGMSQKWPCLNFICPTCIEDCKTKEDVVMSSRVRVLEENSLATNKKQGEISDLLSAVLFNKK